MKKRKPSSRRDVEHELRYLRAENVVADFGTARDRKVIAAVWSWLSLNGVVAWRTKKGDFDTNARPGRRMRDPGRSDAVVIREDAWRHAAKVFGRR